MMNERESQEQVHLIPPGTSVASRASDDAPLSVIDSSPSGLERPLPWLHIFAQYTHHAEARIVGSAAGLRVLAEAIGKALAGNEAESEPVFVNDGEGYSVMVALLSDEAMDKEMTPYIFEYENHAEAQWRERAFKAEHALFNMKRLQLRGQGGVTESDASAGAAEGTPASNEPDGPASAALSASLPALLLQAVEALEDHLDVLDEYPTPLVPINRTRGTTKQLRVVAAALRQRIGESE